MAGTEWCGAGVEPLGLTDEMPNAAPNSASVAARSRLGVSQVWCGARSNERAPVAPAIVAITQPAHISDKLARCYALPSSEISPPGVSERPTCTRGIVSGADALSVMPPAVVNPIVNPAARTARTTVSL